VRRESLASLCIDYEKKTEEALSASASGTVGSGISNTLHGSQGGDKGERYHMHRQVGQRMLGWICWLYSRVGPGSIDFRFRFSAESPALLSVAHTVSAECVGHFQPTFGFRR